MSTSSPTRRHDADRVPHAARTRPLAKIAVSLAVTSTLVAGVLLWGRLASTETVAMLLTGAWFAIVLAAAALVARRRPDLSVALAAGYGLATIAALVLLVLPQLRDRAVDERVATAAPPAASANDGEADTSAGSDDGTDRTAAVENDTADRAATVDNDDAVAGEESARSRGGAEDATAENENVELRRGRFTPLAHPGTGRASVIELASGGRVLTLTDFETDPGPDLRVYLTEGDPAEGEDVGEFVDLGALKGNVGDQQYKIPDDVDLDMLSAAVVWCRAFAVGFTSAAF